MCKKIQSHSETKYSHCFIPEFLKECVPTYDSLWKESVRAGSCVCQWAFMSSPEAGFYTSFLQLEGGTQWTDMMSPRWRIMISSQQFVEVQIHRIQNVFLKYATFPYTSCTIFLHMVNNKCCKTNQLSVVRKSYYRYRDCTLECVCVCVYAWVHWPWLLSMCYLKDYAIWVGK